VSAASVGAADLIAERRSFSPLRLSALLVTLVFVLSACDGEKSAPQRLVDGSAPETLHVELEGLSRPTVLTKVRVTRVSEIAAESLASKCLRGRAPDEHPIGRVVERTAVYSVNVTLRLVRGLYACDDSPGPRADERRWCGGSFGSLYGGDLRDPRLDIGGCSTANGQPVASVWVEPGPATRYVVVHQSDFSEVYEVAARLAVRVSSVDGIHDDPLGATFRISEHDAAGKLLREYPVDAFPAG
jgi:hypothetical protein